MPVSSLDALPEAFVSETAMSSAISHGVQQGRLRKLGSRLYTRNLIDPPEAIVRRNLWQLVGAYRELVRRLSRCADRNVGCWH